MMSSLHDIYAVKQWLEMYKFKFVQNQTRQNPWPILKYFVTDFSYAMLQAVCLAWNNMKIIDYVNHLFNCLNDKTDKTLLSDIVQIHLCCAHLMKKLKKDLKEHFHFRI